MVSRNSQELRATSGEGNLPGLAEGDEAVVKSLDAGIESDSRSPSRE
jgi:hypothetical protein